MRVMCEAQHRRRIPQRACDYVVRIDSLPTAIPSSMIRPNLKAFASIVESPASMVVSTGFAVLSPQGITASFLYLTTTDEFADYLMGRARGAAYPAVNTEDFELAPLVIPSRSILKKMDEIVEPMLMQVHRLLQKNTTLRRTRDMLLPKLISGEIEVDAAGPA